MKYLDQIDVAGKKVLLRADLNVPLENGSIEDDTRIRAAIPTIQFIRNAGGKVVVCSHLGRPKGKPEPELSLRPVAERLSQLLDTNVSLTPDCAGSETQEKINALQVGVVLLLENLRFDPREKNNDPEFARTLAAYADLYVNDAFGTAHRSHASTVGVTKFVQQKAAGFVMQKELENFSQSFTNPEHPFVAIFGGVKASTKIPAMTHVATKADKILVGGAMANTFFVALGLEIGKSLYEKEQVETATSIMEHIEESGCELFLPEDVVVAKELASGVETQIVPRDQIPADMMALDIGPKTLQLFKDKLADAKTVVWNGPMGAFEFDGFGDGTYGIVDALADLKQAYTVVGGGDTDHALHRRHAFDKMSYVSTGGGAFLKMLEGETLPAVAALE